MGCDIHMYAEKLQKGKWVKVGDVFDNPYYEPEGADYSWNTPKTCHPYIGRNYNLFAILADVRNGYGFAGCKTGEPMEPIDEPRGLPYDVSKEVKVESDGWGIDGHSHSYFTLGEILAYSWTNKKTHYGWVTMEDYKTFLEEGKPACWCGGVSGGGVRKVSNDRMEELIEKGKEDPKDNIYTQIEWETEIWEDCRFFLEEVKKMKDMFEEEGLGVDEVRLVFWFDN